MSYLKKDIRELRDYDSKKVQAKKDRKAAEEAEKQKYLDFERSYSRRRRNNE